MIAGLAIPSPYPYGTPVPHVAAGSGNIYIVKNPHAKPAAAVTCASCKACCCRLEVILMGDDDVPPEFIETDRWGGQVMARLNDGWCAALQRDTMLCGIYEQRPGVCRDYAVGDSDCITERTAAGL